MNTCMRASFFFGHIHAHVTVNYSFLNMFKFYEKTGKEVCVVVTNINYVKDEYCHVKTTPDMPVRLAIRMSCSFPGKLHVFHTGLLDNNFTECRKNVGFSD
jgi:hypothetical protein